MRLCGEVVANGLQRRHQSDVMSSATDRLLHALGCSHAPRGRIQIRSRISPLLLRTTREQPLTRAHAQTHRRTQADNYTPLGCALERTSLSCAAASLCGRKRTNFGCAG
jgi:hypothetical protein